MKDGFQKATGVSVALLAPDTDACATRQIRAFMEELRSLGPEEEAALREKLARFRAIEIRPTVTSKTISGVKVDLALGYQESYVDNVCYSLANPYLGCRYSPFQKENDDCVCKDVAKTRFVERARKRIADSITSSGTDPVTQITRGDRLVIQTQQAQSEVREGSYSTASAAAYQDVQKFEDEAFNQAVRYQALDGYTSTHHFPDCGKLASIRDL